MIDKAWQGKGLGKQALQTSIDFVKTMPCGKAEFVWLSYEAENTAARALYYAAGFHENNELCDGETEAFHFELTQTLADSQLKLVLDNIKRATASSLYAYEIQQERLPQVNDFNILTDWAGTPFCVIKTTAVTILPFHKITFALCMREGEDDTLESWQKTHRAFFTKEGNALGYSFCEDMPVVFEDFEVVYRR